MAKRQDAVAVAAETSAAKVYVYCGDGAGIPGLPHEISLQEAQDLGVSDILTSAIGNGSYKAKEA